jgi:hypothetical protein
VESESARGEVRREVDGERGGVNMEVDAGRREGGRGRGVSESGFPSTGFGGARRAGGERRDMVRFLSGGSGEGM